jgi:hypothetical protein
VIAGKVWIAIVAFALIGIVTLQLGLLELNTGIGRLLEREAVLQRENAALGVENSELASSERIHAGAVKLGYAPARTSALRFLATQPSDVGHAAGTLNTPLHAAGSATGGEAGGPEAGAHEGSGQESSSHEAASSGGSSAGESSEAATRERSGGETSAASSAEAPAAGAREASGSGEAERERSEPSAAGAGAERGVESAAGGASASPGG